MNKKITATLSLTKHQWGLLFLMVKSSAPHLPKEVWELTWELCDDIEEALEDSVPSLEVNEIEEARQYFKKIVDFDEEENNDSE